MFSDICYSKNLAFAEFRVFDKAVKVRTYVHVIMMDVRTLHRIYDTTLQNYASFLVTNTYRKQD